MVTNQETKKTICPTSRLILFCPSTIMMENYIEAIHSFILYSIHAQLTHNLHDLRAEIISMIRLPKENE